MHFHSGDKSKRAEMRCTVLAHVQGSAIGGGYSNSSTFRFIERIQLRFRSFLLRRGAHLLLGSSKFSYFLQLSSFKPIEFSKLSIFGFAQDGLLLRKCCFRSPCLKSK